MLAVTIEIFEKGLNPGVTLAILFMLFVIATLLPLLLLPEDNKQQEAISRGRNFPLYELCAQCTHVVTGANATAVMEIHKEIRHPDTLDRHIAERDRKSPGFRQKVCRDCRES